MNDENQRDQRSWEIEKFEREMKIREREIELTAARTRTERLRMIVIGALVPVVTLIVTVVPTHLVSLNQQTLQRERFEADLIIKMISTGNQLQAQRNLRFLIDAGLLGDLRARRVAHHLAKTAPQDGKVLPNSD